jgi:phage-related protein
MDQYDATAKSLTARVERIAEQISQQAQRNAATVEPFFIDDVFNAVGNAVGDVANAVGDAVNAAVNATQDAVNAVENIGKDVINVTDDAINATENIIHAVTDHTDIIHNIANVTLEALNITPDVADFIGFAPIVEAKDKVAAASQPAVKASAAQLLQVRRALLREKNKALAAQTASKRTEIRNKIASIRASIAAAKARSGPR